MLKTVWAVVREGKIELLENLSLSEGARVLVTLIPDEDEQQFLLFRDIPTKIRGSSLGKLDV